MSRILMIASGSPATVFALAPLAHALRNEGHAVLVAANDSAVPAVLASGLTAVPATARPILDFIATGRDGRPDDGGPTDDGQRRHTGRWFARMALAHREALRPLVRDWRPGLIVGGTMSYAADLLAAEFGVPHVRQAWDAIDAAVPHLGAAGELAPELAELGLTTLPAPAAFVDVCPPRLGASISAPTPRVLALRWTPGNLQRAVEPWMYTRGPGARVCLTAGSRVSLADEFGGLQFLRDQLKVLGELAGDIVVAAPDDVAARLRAEFPGIRAGWVPLDVVAGTCDLLVHNGGGTTTLTGFHGGVTQLIFPSGVLPRDGAAAAVGAGAALALPASGCTVADIEDACSRLLGDESFARSARAIAAEIRDMPGPAAVATALGDLARAS